MLHQWKSWDTADPRACRVCVECLFLRHRDQTPSIVRGWFSVRQKQHTCVVFAVGFDFESAPALLVCISAANPSAAGSSLILCRVRRIDQLREFYGSAGYTLARFAFLIAAIMNTKSFSRRKHSNMIATGTNNGSAPVSYVATVMMTYNKPKTVCRSASTICCGEAFMSSIMQP